MCCCDTSTIEGGTLAEEETAQALAFDPSHVRETEERRVLNLKAAYDLSKKAASTPGWTFFRVPTSAQDARSRPIIDN